MAKLKPCPFCGGEAEIYDDRNQTYSVGAFGECRNGVPTYYKVFCKECGACSAVAKVEKDCRYNTWWQNQAKTQAIKSWNTRITKHGELGQTKERQACKVGDTVYQFDDERIYESKIKRIIYDTDNIAFDERAIGKSILLTKPEAEQKLKNLQNNNKN